MHVSFNPALRLDYVPCRGHGEPNVVRKVSSGAVRQNKTGVVALFQGRQVDILVDSRRVAVNDVRSTNTAAGAWCADGYVANAITVEIWKKMVRHRDNFMLGFSVFCPRVIFAV